MYCVAETLCDDGYLKVENNQNHQTKEDSSFMRLLETKHNKAAVFLCLVLSKLFYFIILLDP